MHRSRSSEVLASAVTAGLAQPDVEGLLFAACTDHVFLTGGHVLDFANKRWIGGMNLITNRGRHYHTEAFEDMIEDLVHATDIVP